MVVGCLVAVFVVVDSRALEPNTAQVAQAYTAASVSAAPQALSFQGQSDAVKQDDKKGTLLSSIQWYPVQA